METPTGDEELEIAVLKEELRALGWYVRYTEWPTGHQVVLHSRADTSRHLVTEWHAAEVDAWREALRLAERSVAERQGEGARPADGEWPAPPAAQ